MNRAVIEAGRVKELPLSLKPPTLEAFMRGRCTRVRRPADGMYAKLAPGDLLWIREPYHLPRRVNHLSPTKADVEGALPVFATDVDHCDLERRGLGPSRPSFTLLRDWHRQHARVAFVTRERLQSISLAEVKAAGFPTLGGWAATWDHDVVSVTGRNAARTWAANPVVLVIELERFASPLSSQPTTNAPMVPA